MKKLILLALVILTGAAFNTAEAKKKKDKKKATPVAVVPVKLLNSSDSLSYAAGMTIAPNFLQYLQQVEKVDTAYYNDVLRGYNDFLAQKDDPKFRAYAAGLSAANQISGPTVDKMRRDFTDTPDTIVATLVERGFADGISGDTTVFKNNTAANKFFRQRGEENRQIREEKLYGANKRAGQEFLRQNARRDSVVTLPSKLQYKVLVKGNGPIPKKTDEVQVYYEGRLIDGTVFDSHRSDGGKPATFRPTQVIKGWTEALTMMPVGSKWQLYIPQELAYGKRAAGKIPPYSTLIFDVELVGIGNAQADGQAQEASAQQAAPAKPAKPAPVKSTKLKRTAKK
ncbi:MAG: FKBP-type peptidyl-prolyl cis-trans isomerase [Prevotella sp.]|nr:FKBP-type peptidyl-prolyl cis-trans isomerase [Prevotella sp.]